LQAAARPGCRGRKPERPGPVPIPCILVLAALLGAAQEARSADPPPPGPSGSLDTIVVAAPKLPVETFIDRKVYNVTTDLQSTFGTVSDILNAVPSVDVDPDGVVTLRGDSNVLVLIDGKPSTELTGTAAGDNLQSLGAADIERVEIMTTPPAQFKADGAAGVINIITRRKRPKGLAGSLQASAGNDGRFNLAGNSSYVTGPLTLALTAGFRHDYRARLLQSDVRVPDAAAGSAADSASVLREQIHRQVPAVGLSSQYALDEAQSLNAAVNWSERGGLRTYTQRNDGIAPDGVLEALSQRSSYGHDPEFSHDEKLGYTRKLGAKGGKLELNLHRSTSEQLERYDYTDDSLLPSTGAALSRLTLLEVQSATDAGVDYALPLRDSGLLKLGYAFEQDGSRYGNFGSSLDPVTRAPAVDPTLTHDFEYRQQIEAGYLSYQASAGSWNGLAGVRAELTRSTADQLTEGTSSRRSYFGLFPSLHLERSVSAVSTISFGASRRISRPDPGNLDPYVDHEYTPNLRAGNAGLQPQYTQSYELGYGYEQDRTSLQLTGYYRRNRDSVTDITRYLGNGYSLTTKVNLPRNDAAGIELAANGNVVPALSYSLSGNLFHSQIDASALGTPGLRSTNGVNAKLKFDYRVTAADTAQLLVTRTDKRLTPQGYVGAINIVNLGYKRRLRRDLTAIATLSDLFNGQRIERFETTPAFSGDYLRAVQGRVAYLGLVYSFGGAGKAKEDKLEYDSAD
jgi:outer membrane receptor protein involved in Fe transport